MKADIYNIKGKAEGTIDLPENIFNVNWNDALVHQVVVSMQANARVAIAHTKDRAEVRGGGKKPWKQKGTGRARHGSSRSPIWVGGGITHGPRNEKVFAKKINKVMRARALFAVLSRKLKDGEIVFVDSFNLTAPKAKDARNILTSLGKIKGHEELVDRRNNSALIALGIKDANAAKSFSNFGNVKLIEARNINPVDALTYRRIIFVNPKEALETLSARK